MGRMIGLVFPDDKKPMAVLQHQHATPNGYEIRDKDKRAEFEKRKSEFQKSKSK